MKKNVSSLVVGCAIMVFASWQYRLLCVLLCILINKSWMLHRTSKAVYRILCWSLVVGIFCAVPNYFQRGRTQLHYISKSGDYRHAPVPVYLANALLPEKEVCNLGIKAVALLGGGVHGVGGSLLDDAREDFWKGKLIGLYSSYNNLSHPGSFAFGQLWNELTHSGYDAIYITRPRHYDEGREYPVVFFCHGYLGSWELYQGILDELDGCYVVSIGTKDLSGIFSYQDINRIFSKYMPYLEKQGCGIDKSHIHLIGLSNGGTAADVALRSFSGKFKTITYMSTPCNVVKYSKSKVLMVCGGKDREGFGIRNTKKKLERCGTHCSILYDEGENHYMLVRKKKEVVDFLNKEMGLSM